MSGRPSPSPKPEKGPPRPGQSEPHSQLGEITSEPPRRPGDGDTLRDPGLGGVGRRWELRADKTWSSGPKVPVSGSSRTPDSRLRLVPTSAGGGGPAPAPSRAFPGRGAQQKVGESGGQTPDPSLLTWRRRARVGPGPSPRAAAPGTAAVSTESGPRVPPPPRPAPPGPAPRELGGPSGPLPARPRRGEDAPAQVWAQVSRWPRAEAEGAPSSHAGRRSAGLGAAARPAG